MLVMMCEVVSIPCHLVRNDMFLLFCKYEGLEFVTILEVIRGLPPLHCQEREAQLNKALQEKYNLFPSLSFETIIQVQIPQAHH